MVFGEYCWWECVRSIAYLITHSTSNIQGSMVVDHNGVGINFRSANPKNTKKLYCIEFSEQVPILWTDWMLDTFVYYHYHTTPHHTNIINKLLKWMDGIHRNIVRNDIIVNAILFHQTSKICSVSADMFWGFRYCSVTTNIS